MGERDFPAMPFDGENGTRYPAQLICAYSLAFPTLVYIRRNHLKSNWIFCAAPYAVGYAGLVVRYVTDKSAIEITKIRNTRLKYLIFK